MRQRLLSFGLVALIVALAMPAGAQDYRARVQGVVVDSSGGALPGVNVTLKNDNTGIEVVRQSDAEGHYLFDFVDPGTYTVLAELEGFKKAEQRNVRVVQRGDITANLTLEIGALSESITVEAAPVAVQFNSSSTDMTLESKLIDQVPINGRNPYNLMNLDPANTQSVNVNENRPYHHAYANDYDAGGGTRRGNAVLLDGVPLGASYKTAYTPSMDAVEEITVSKNSVDAENGNSLGGLISLNMKSGTNVMHGSAYYFGRNPSMNARSDATVVITPTTNVKNLRGTDLSMFGGTFGGPIMKNKIFSFTSFEQWYDNKPLTVVRTVPTALERAGDFSQSVQSGRVRTIYNPFSSSIDPTTGRVVRNAFAGNRIPTSMLDPTALRLLAQIPQPNQPGNTDNWQGTKTEEVDYWNLSQRVDVNFTDNWKVFGRFGKFKANTYEANPTEGDMFPLAGSNRYGMSFAADSVWVMSNKTTLNIRGSYYNMTDEYYNPTLELGQDGLAQLWPNNPWYTSLYNSGYVYYPRLDVTSGTGTNTTGSLGRQGREWFQRPDAYNISARMNRYQGEHSMKWGGEVPPVLRRGRTLRADQPRLQLGRHRQQHRQPGRHQHRQPVGVLHAGCHGHHHQRERRAAADAVPEQLLALLPGRLAHQRPHDAQRRYALGVRARSDRPRQPHLDAVRHRHAERGDDGGSAGHERAGGCADGQQGLRLLLHGRVDLRDQGRPERVAQHLEELPAARGPDLQADRRLGAQVRLRALSPARDQRPRHARRLRRAVRRLLAGQQPARVRQRRPAAGAGQPVPLQCEPGHHAVRPGLRRLHEPGWHCLPRRVRAATADQ